MSGTLSKHLSSQLLNGLVLFAAYTALAYFGLNWAQVGGAASLIWPASGLGLAALLLGGTAIWPAIFAGRVAAGVLTGSDQPLWAELLIGLGNSVGSVAAVIVLRRLGGIERDLASLRHVTKFLIAASIGSAIPSLVGSLALLWAGSVPSSNVIHVGWNWFVGNFVGALTIAPLVLAWSRGMMGFQRTAYLLVLLLVSCAVAWAIFAELSQSSLYPWHLLPLLVLAALQFGVRGTSALLVMVSSIAIWGSSLGLGPFAILPNGVAVLQQFIAIMALTSLFLAASSGERRSKRLLADREKQLRVAEERARTQAEELEVILDSVPAAIFVARDPQCKDITGNQFAANLLRVRDHSANMSKSGEHAAELTHFKVLNAQGEELDPDQLPVQRAAQGEVMRDFEERVVFTDGTYRCLLGAATPLLNPDGSPRGAVAVFIDVTERKAAEDRAQLLAREVDHRAKNIMAIIQAIMRLTKADSIEAFRKAVTGRINSLARTHSFLAGNRWDRAELGHLIREELSPYMSQFNEGDGAEAITIGGPSVRLQPDVAQALALAIHELTTNAVKYGGLSSSSGRLEVTWQLYKDDNRSDLVLSWRESDGPNVYPPSRCGFGLSLLKTTLEDQLKGKLETNWNATGLDIQMTLPLGPDI